MKARICLGLSVVLLSKCFANGTEIESLSVPVDTTWRAIGPVGDLTGQPIGSVGLDWEAAHVGWNTAADFDDTDAAGWKNSIEVIHSHEPFVRYWVDGTDVIGSSPAYFRRVVNIPGTPTDATLAFGVDDDASIFINGSVVFTDSDGLYTDFTGANVLPYLHTGPNLIAVKAHDLQGAQSIWGQLDVRYQVPELSSSLLAGIAAFVSGLNLRHRKSN